MREFTADKIRLKCEPSELSTERTDEVKPLEHIIGQERALKAMQFGLGIKEEGFNIYVAGQSGTGKTTAVRDYLEDIARQKPSVHDWCYVNNFQDHYQPNVLRLPRGKGREFAEEVKNLIEAVRREIPRAFESEVYIKQREEALESYNEQKKKLFTGLNQKAQEENLVIQTSPAGFVIIPVKEGRPLNEQELMDLSDEEKEIMNKKKEELGEDIKAVIRDVSNIDKEANEALKKVDKEVALFAVGHLINDLIDEYKDITEVKEYLTNVYDDILENLSLFREDQSPQQAPFFSPVFSKEISFRKYQVNTVVDHSETEGAPVIIELNPTHNNLFGRIEKEHQMGAMVTDFTKIKGGSLHKANGGYLVIPVEELLKNLFSWESLKRALRNKEITIEEASERLGFMVTQTLRPDPILLDIKIILIGDPYIYHLLYNYDPDFSELFKVKAEFDIHMNRTKANIQKYASFVSTLCQKESLCHLDASALAKVIEYSSRLAEDQQKLSTRFSEIADIIREANYYSSIDNSTYIDDTHIKKAIEEKLYRSNLIQEKIQELIERDIILIDTVRDIVGQVNGLSVLSMGDLMFGRPSRITASLGVGREGLIDIEREAKLGGKLHTKGVMILSGYLSSKFAQDFPLTLSARLVFEQSYSGVDGDSASSAELYALLSVLSDLPLKQSIAVTGSVNQKGEVQAIGGVNEKIEGFFEVCRFKGLNGEQGVIIPESNATNLMLKEEIVAAVKEKKFHIYSVNHINEGVEILTGVPAGEQQPDGTFPEDTVNARVARRLKLAAEKLRDFTDKKNKK